MNNVKLKKFRPTAKVPTQGTEFAAGYDLFADIEQDVVIPPHGTAGIPTGLGFEPPSGHHFKVESRSGTAIKNSIGVMCGVIDEDYRGELKVVLFNNSGDTEFVVKPGQKIAQILLVKSERMAFEEVDNLCSSQRGDAGFGSTGNA